MIITTQAELDAAVKAKADLIEISGSGYFEISGQVSVHAWGQATVRASGQATVHPWGQATVRAEKYNAITIMGSFQGKIKGGVQIKIPIISTVKTWCDFNGLKISKGVVIVFKAVNEFFASPRGTEYKPGSMPEATDWDGGKAECGGGLHFSPTPFQALVFNPDAKKFIACPVALKDMRVPQANDKYPEKIKARRVCAPCFEVDINENPVKGG